LAEKLGFIPHNWLSGIFRKSTPDFDRRKKEATIMSELLEELDEMFKEYQNYKFYGAKIFGHVCTVSDRTLRAWEMAMTIPTIQFPEPEGHWHYKWRMFKSWLRQLPAKIRWRVFPYHVIHKDEYEEMFEYE
jgi:hypothetical protein